MAKERLSRLQKWILNQILENIRNEKYKTLENKIQQCIYRQDIYRDYFKLSHSRHGTWPKSKIVIVSRSLRNLEEKGFVTIPKHLRPRGCMIFLSNEYVKFLNEQSKKKALMLTKQINNKKGGQ